MPRLKTEKVCAFCGAWIYIKLTRCPRCGTEDVL